jgi:hypothetical protein
MQKYRKRECVENAQGVWTHNSENNFRKHKNNSCHFVILILKWGEDMEKE